MALAGSHSRLSSPGLINLVLGSCSVGSILAWPGLVQPWHQRGLHNPHLSSRDSLYLSQPPPKKAASSSFSGFVVPSLFLNPTAAALAATHPRACWENSTLIWHLFLVADRPKLLEEHRHDELDIELIEATAESLYIKVACKAELRK